MNIINYLEQTGQTTEVFTAMEQDNYQDWIRPVIHYAEQEGVSALGSLATLIDWFSDKSEEQMRGSL